MLTACGGGGDSTEPNLVTPRVNQLVTIPVTSQSLEGSWSTSCSASKSLTGYDEQQIFNFKGDKLTTNKFFYVQNTNCKHSAEVLRARITAGIELGKSVNPGTDTGHTKIDIQRTKVILAAMNSTVTNLFNNADHTSNESIYNGYGNTGWKALFWKNISNVETPDITAVRTNFKIDKTEHDILQISKKMVDGTTHKVLKLGIKGGNVDSDSRPISLAGSITATLQKKTIETQTAQAAGLTGQWKYACTMVKNDQTRLQTSTLDFEGNKLTTTIYFYDHNDNQKQACSYYPLYQVEIEADIVLGKVINAGEVNEHTQIGIKTTKVQIKLDPTFYTFTSNEFNKGDFYNTPIPYLYYGYGQTDWQKDKWKDISSAPDAIEKLNIGTQVPDIFKISTATDGSKELKMGYSEGSYDINGRAIAFEPKGAVFQPK